MEVCSNRSLSSILKNSPALNTLRDIHDTLIAPIAGHKPSLRSFVMQIACIDIVSTAFDPSLSDNRKFPAEHNSRTLNVAWTKKERELAEMGETVGDLSELQRRVSG